MWQMIERVLRFNLDHNLLLGLTVTTVLLGFVRSEMWIMTLGLAVRAVVLVLGHKLEGWRYVVLQVVFNLFLPFICLWGVLCWST